MAKLGKSLFSEIAKGSSKKVHKTISDRITSLFLPISAILMEAFCGYPWFIWTGKWETLHWQHPPLGVLTLLALVAISFLTTRFMTNRSLSSPTIKLIITGLGLFVIFIVIRIEYGNGIELLSNRWFVYIGRIILDSFSNLSSITLAFLAAVYFWWRGMLLGRKQDYNYIHSNIVFGAGSFLVLGLIWWGTMGTTSFSNMATTIGPYVAAFFFFGLAGTAFNNLRNVQRRMPREETQPISYSRWMLFILSIVTVIITIGGAIATASSLDVGSYVKRLLSVISGFFETLLSWLAVPLEYILKYVLMPFEWIARNIIELLIRLFGVNTMQVEGEEGIGEDLPEIVPGISPEEWLTVIKWMLFIIVVIGITILIARSVEKNRRRRPETTLDFEVTHESLWSWRLFITNVIIFFKRLFRRFIPQIMGRGAALTGTTTTTQIEPTVTTLKIREIFKHLLRDAAKMGVGRHHSETPFEYAQRFSKEIPDTSASIQELTELYVNVRYSDRDVATSQVVRANGLWQQIRASLKKSTS